MTKILKSLWPAATVNFFYYSIFGGVISYLAILLTAREFTSVEIGQLFAIYTLSRVAAGQIWAWLSDWKSDPRLFFQIGLLMALLCLLPNLFSQDKWLIFISITAAMTCFMSVVSQIEVLSLLAAKDDPVVYNRIRLFGSVGFIVAAVLIGWLIDIVGPDLVLSFGMLAIVATLLTSTKLVASQAHIHSDDKGELSDDFWRRCRSWGFVVFMLASILLQMSFAPYISFFTKYLAEHDYQGVEIGLLFSLGTLAEIVLFMYAGRLLGRFSIKLLMSFCLILTAGRWLAVAYLVDSWLAVVISQLIHAFSFGLMHSASIYFIRQQFASHQQNRGQFMYLGATFGFGGAMGMALTGVTWENGLGGTTTFLWASVSVFIAALLILMTPRRKFQYDVTNPKV